MLSVEIIRVKNEAALVEYVSGGEVYRCVIPTSEINVFNTVPEDVLDAGVPYGVKWGNVAPPVVTGDMLESALHKAGIWTLEDLQSKSKAAIGAIQATYGVTLSSLYQLAREVKDHDR